MSLMCKLGKSCRSHHGLCVHEKVMLGMMMLVIAAGLIYWLA